MERTFHDVAASGSRRSFSRDTWYIYIQIKAKGRKNLVTNIGFLEKWRVLDFDCRNHNNNKSLNVLM